MSVSGPTSNPTSPRTIAAKLQAVRASGHASDEPPSPRPPLVDAGNPFGGDAEAMRTSAAPGDSCHDARDPLPQQVQISVRNAPAEFCMPIKRDKRFRPNFQIEVPPHLPFVS